MTKSSTTQSGTINSDNTASVLDLDTKSITDLLLFINEFESSSFSHQESLVLSSIAMLSSKLSALIKLNPDSGLVSQWLQFVSISQEYGEEGVVDATQELFDLYPEEFLSGLDSLPRSAKPTIEAILSGVPIDRNFDLGEISTAPTATSQLVLAEFVAERVLRRGRGPTYQGTLTIFDENSQPVGRYTANTGRVGNGYTRYGGPIPPGMYNIVSHASPVKGDAYQRHDISYWFKLLRRPGTDVYGRSGFGIHPDGNVFGTLGCVGIFESKANTLRCEQQLLAGLGSGFSRILSIDYSNIISRLPHTNMNLNEDLADFMEDGELLLDNQIDDGSGYIEARGGPGGVLGELISRGEGDYGSYNRGRAGDSGGRKIDFTKMAIGTIIKFQSLPRGNPTRLFAIGKYQLIPSTMLSAVRNLSIDIDRPLTHRMQEILFRRYLVAAKRPDIKRYIVGGGSLRSAQFALAYEFASVARPDTGRSHYGGSGNNSASISASETARALQTERAEYARFMQDGRSPEESWNALSPGI